MLYNFLKTLFFLSIFVALFTYTFYPLILYVLKKLLKNKKVQRKKITPNVSLIVAAYNEEEVIEEKIRNCFELDYPREKLEIIVGSDGSSDRTNEIIKTYTEDNPNLKVCQFDKRRGKPSVLNDLVKVAKGDVICFSDANTFIEEGALKKIVQNFADETVGCVCGRLILRDKSKKNAPEGLYWRYETKIKEMESNIASVMGANGGFYAIRRVLWEDISPNILVDDFVVSMKIVGKGYRTVFEPNALAYEETANSIKDEFVRRVRIGAGNYQSIFILKKLLNPLRGLVAFEFWSHKIFRWGTPFMLVNIFICSLFLAKESSPYLIFLVIQIGCIILAVVGHILKIRGKPIKVAILIRDFLLMNIALGIGFFKYMFKIQQVTWKRTER